MGQGASDLEDFEVNRMALNEKGMYVLGSWALGNMALSGSLLAAGPSDNTAFHQMNLGWNAVNLALAGFGLYQAQQGAIAQDWTAVLEDQYQMEQILLFNAGLDLAYIAGGFWMRQKALTDKRPDRWRGFGNAVIMNGAFLFVFDLAFYYFQQAHRKSDLLPLLENLQFGVQSFGFRYSF